MRILILCDLEGTAGVVDFKTQTYDGGRDNEQAKYLATLEINALIDGAMEGGATDPIVLDGHGSGGINIEHIHREARVIYGRPRGSAWEMGLTFEAQFLYGHHAMENTPDGVLCHSWSSRSIANCWLNDELIGEIGFNIAHAGEVGVPTVFVSGDRAAVDGPPLCSRHRRRCRERGAQPHSCTHPLPHQSSGSAPRTRSQGHGANRGNPTLYNPIPVYFRDRISVR